MNAIKFRRVNGIQSAAPVVLAAIEDHFVRWKPQRGWDCTCLTPEDEFECEHIMTIQGMLDDRVTGEA